MRWIRNNQGERWSTPTLQGRKLKSSRNKICKGTMWFGVSTIVSFAEFWSFNAWYTVRFPSNKSTACNDAAVFRVQLCSSGWGEHKQKDVGWYHFLRFELFLFTQLWRVETVKGWSKPEAHATSLHQHLSFSAISTSNSISPTPYTLFLFQSCTLSLFLSFYLLPQSLSVLPVSTSSFTSTYEFPSTNLLQHLFSLPPCFFCSGGGYRKKNKLPQ